MLKINERMFYFAGNKKRKLLGFLHLPEIRSCGTGVIYCHPFANEQNLSHRVIVDAARKFALNGIPVLRFDMSGCGDSDGELNDITLDDWIEDLKKAITVFKENTNCSNYILWGLRLGAGLSLNYTSRYKDDCPIILWQPVIDFQEYIKKFFRKKYTTQISAGANRFSIKNLINEIHDRGFVNIIGYPITKNLYHSFIDISQKYIEYLPESPKLVVSISLMENPSTTMKRYADMLDSQKSSLQFKHVNTDPFWDRYWRLRCPEVQDVTMKWIKNYL